MPQAEAGPVLTAADGSRLAAVRWVPAGPVRAVILAVHGFGDYGQSTFDAAARAWAKRGILTIAYDQRGFGRNPSRGRWPGAEALIADAVAVSHQIRARHPCLPLTVLGHSMGGGVVLAAAAQDLAGGSIVLAAAAQDLAGGSIVLAAPAIWGGAYLNPVLRAVAWSAATLTPDHRYTGEGIVSIQATDNLAVLRRMRADPLYLTPPSAREMMGLVRLMDAAEGAAGQVSRPALLLLGAQDQIVPNDKVREVFGMLTGPKRIIEYPEGWHLLFRDLQAVNVWRDVGDWALVQPGPESVCSRAGETAESTEGRNG